MIKTNVLELPSFYRRYVDDTLTVMLDVATATADFLDMLNNAHSSVKFTMEIESSRNCSLFFGIQLLNNPLG